MNEKDEKQYNTDNSGDKVESSQLNTTFQKISKEKVKKHKKTKTGRKRINRFFKGVFRKETRESILLTLNFLTLLSFIIFNVIQGYYTRKSINLTRISIEKNDSSSRDYKRNIKLYEDFIRHTKHNDSIVNSMTKESNKFFMSNIKTEDRAYLCINTITDFEINSSKEFKYKIKIVNTGRTPAFNITYTSTL